MARDPLSISLSFDREIILRDRQEIAPPFGSLECRGSEPVNLLVRSHHHAGRSTLANSDRCHDAATIPQYSRPLLDHSLSACRIKPGEERIGHYGIERFAGCER